MILMLALAVAATFAAAAWFGPVVWARWQGPAHKSRELSIFEERERSLAAINYAEARKLTNRLTAGSAETGNYAEGLILPNGEIIVLRPGPAIEYPRLHSLREDYRMHNDTLPAAPTVMQLPAAAPRRLDLKDRMELIQPGRALLAVDDQGEGIYTDIDSLVHPAIAGSTGGGKTAIERLLLMNLILAGVKCYLLDPHFAMIDTKSKEDWRPIVGRLAAPPILAPRGIAEFVAHIANVEMARRYDRRAHGLLHGEALCLFIDELPSVVAGAPGIVKDITKILREGRKVDIFVSCAAQDFLVSTIGGSGGVRDCFRTAYYTGGDATTARVLLDVSPGQRVDEAGLGKGTVMLRSAATPTAQRVLVPYVSNEALYAALGDPGEIILATYNAEGPDDDEPPAEETPEKKAAKVYKPGMTIRALEREAGINFYQAKKYIDGRK